MEEKILKSLKENMGIISNVCEDLNITLDFFNELIKNEEFAKKVEQVKEFCLDFAESKLFKLIDDENIGAISFYLKEQGSSRGYGNKQPENKLQKQSEEENLFGSFE